MRDIKVFLLCMGVFLLNTKRESKYYIFDVLYNIVLIFLYWEIIYNFYDYRFVIVLFDFFLKFAFYRGVVGNLKNLMYLPITAFQKKVILLFLPIISFTNLALVFMLLLNEQSVFIFLVINSYFIFNLKTNRSEVIHFVFFYTLTSLMYFSFLEGRNSLVVFFLIFIPFFILTIRQLSNYLKLN